VEDFLDPLCPFHIGKTVLLGVFPTDPLLGKGLSFAFYFLEGRLVSFILDVARWCSPGLSQETFLCFPERSLSGQRLVCVI